MTKNIDAHSQAIRSPLLPAPRAAASKLLERRLFFLEVLKGWRKIGAIVPSSRFLVKKVLCQAHVQNAKVVVEFGAGTGTVTGELLKKMNPKGELFVFETNKAFCNILASRYRDARLRIINASAENFKEYLENRKIDCVVSTLPLSLLPKNRVRRFLTEVKSVLRQHGEYVQALFVPLTPLLKGYFAAVSVSFTPLNLPPVFVYRCRN